MWMAPPGKSRLAREDGACRHRRRLQAIGSVRVERLCYHASSFSKAPALTPRLQNPVLSLYGAGRAFRGGEDLPFGTYRKRVCSCICNCRHKLGSENPTIFWRPSNRIRCYPGLMGGFGVSGKQMFGAESQVRGRNLGCLTSHAR
jgi:hypothetical protein